MTRKQRRKGLSSTSWLILLGSVVFTIGMANPMFFFAGLFFVLLFDGKM